MVSQFLNIILQFIEALIVFYFYESITPPDSKNKTKKAVAIILGYAIMCVVNLVFDYNTVINISLLLVFLFLFSYVLYRFKITISIFYAIIITCLITCSEIGVISLINIFIGNESKKFMNNPTSYVILIVLSKSILFLSLVLISTIINRFKVDKKVNFEHLIYPISMLLTASGFAIVFNQNELSQTSSIILTILSVLMIATVIITCIFQQQTSKKSEQMTELKAIQQKQNIENSYFELLEHQNEELQILVHDIQKHLDNISCMQSSSYTINNYVSELSKDLEKSNKIGKTNNKLLDLIIDKYNYLSSKENIEFEKNIHFSNLNFISNVDITSIFNNLFDNAVEAAKQSKDKKMYFSLNSYNDIVVVELSNSCDCEPNVINNHLVSTKQSQEFHGYGFKSIVKSVNKYGGDINWEYNKDEHVFNVSIIFSI